MSVALIVAGVDRIHRDLGTNRRGAVLGDHDRPAEVVELATNLTNHQVTYREVDRRVHGVDGPGARSELAGCGCSHVVRLPTRGDGLPGAIRIAKTDCSPLSFPWCDAPKGCQLPVWRWDSRPLVGDGGDAL